MHNAWICSTNWEGGHHHSDLRLSVRSRLQPQWRRVLIQALGCPDVEYKLSHGVGVIGIRVLAGRALSGSAERHPVASPAPMPIGSANSYERDLARADGGGKITPEHLIRPKLGAAPSANIPARPWPMVARLARQVGPGLIQLSREVFPVSDRQRRLAHLRLAARLY